MTLDPLADVLDEQLVALLALLLDARSRLSDPATADQTRQRLTAAATDPTPLELVDDATGAITPPPRRSRRPAAPTPRWPAPPSPT